jgi:hypothetical protein
MKGREMAQRNLADGLGTIPKRDDGATVHINISVNRVTGRVEVEGPVQDKIFMAGVLELVKKSVLDMKVPQVFVSPETNLKIVAASDNQQEEA